MSQERAAPLNNILFTGSHHYVSVAAAKTFYNGNYEEALKEGRIAVGEPELRPGDWLRVERGRYIICSRPA